IRVDCQGRVLPALARSWEQGPEGRWTVTLRSDARFWDGAPVTARDMLAAWRARDSSLARAVMVPDDRVLSIDPSGLSFQRFADPALAVTKSAPGGGWPIGTGHYWTTGSAGGAEALWASPVPGTGLPALKVTVAPASEARDAVDANADLLLTSDPAALDYGRTRSEYQDAPLGWDHTYVLLAPDGSSLELSVLRLETLPQAVHVEARLAQGDDGGFWLVDLKRCGLAAEAPSTRAPPRRRIVFELRVRADMADRLTTQYQRRVASLVAVIRADLSRDSAGIAGRLDALKDAIAADNRFRLAALQGTDRAYLLDYAGNAMRFTGLAMLQIQDEQGRIISSGHFRNEYDRVEPELPRLLATAPGGMALVEAPTAE